MESLIPVIDQLRHIFHVTRKGCTEIDLPQIAVVGSQSSGKSSVLESIVGRGFLPRGTGVVTRCPIILQLVHIDGGQTEESRKSQNRGKHRFRNSGKTAGMEFCEFEHRPGDKFTDFEAVRAEILQETNRISGKHKGISATPIFLKIYSPAVTNLTLVDLPGMTKVPIDGQPEDIESRVRDLVLDYISKSHCLILAVSAANTDLANSDAIKLAREVDPEGTRTIGVITKIDLMDRGTDAVDMLRGRQIPLRLGYIGVINRSQKDVEEGTSLEDCRYKESQFFASHPSYAALPRSILGSDSLTSRLHSILMAHIRRTLPELRSQITKKITQKQKELQLYGPPPPDSAQGSKGAVLLTMLMSYSDKFREVINGETPDIMLDHLYGGARINYIFHDLFGQTLQQMDACEGLSDEQIRTAIRNATGPRTALFIPEVTFELLVKQQIRRLEEPALRCAELVYDELLRVTSQIQSRELERFPALRNRVIDCMNRLLRRNLEPTLQMITSLVQMEMAYINTRHPDFIGSKALVSSHSCEDDFHYRSRAHTEGALTHANGAPNHNHNARAANSHTQPIQEDRPSSAPVKSVFAGLLDVALRDKLGKSVDEFSFVTKEGCLERRSGSFPPLQQHGSPSPGDRNVAQHSEAHDECVVIRRLLRSYFGIVRKNIQDSVPKAVMLLIVNATVARMHSDLVEELYKPDQLDTLLAEDPEVTTRRQACVENVAALQDAIHILNAVRDAAPPESFNSFSEEPLQ
eukprot:Rmarinus@m.21664